MFSRPAEPKPVTHHGNEPHSGRQLGREYGWEKRGSKSWQSPVRQSEGNGRSCAGAWIQHYYKVASSALSRTESDSVRW